jgi:hypothetical protein
MPTPLAHTDHEKPDFEIGWRLPLAKHLEDSLLGILILQRRTLRAFESADLTARVVVLPTEDLVACQSFSAQFLAISRPKLSPSGEHLNILWTLDHPGAIRLTACPKI